MSLDVQPLGQPFDEVLHLIEAAKQRAYQAVNTTLIELYWQVGEFVSRKLAAAEWGDAVVEQLAAYIAQTQAPTIMMRSSRIGSNKAVIGAIFDFKISYLDKLDTYKEQG